ncbi:MAG TPA: PadR family transcriptional regulator [Solirubrobacterales bacterium]|jgi:DNA-binding PadR family transcriptional regulator|nr:PadR family transcriptional regulator [Solirubrobacterales bacterium]
MKSKPIKLTPTSFALLALLDRFGELTSYEIKDALETSVENFWPVPHTTAYQEPARLASGGYLSARQEKGGRRRRRYALTDAGREALRAWADEPVAAPPQLRDELLLKIFAGADPEPLIAARIDWYQAKIEEYESYLGAVKLAPGWSGPERTLRGGIKYHRKMIEVFDEMRAEEEG